MKWNSLIVIVLLIIALYFTSDVWGVFVGVKVLNRSKANGTHPELQLALDEWPYAFAIKVTSGVRTHEQQSALYAKGRSVPGEIVTYAETAEDTAHGRGAAIDIVPAPNGVALYGDSSLPLYKVMASHFLKRGMVWGGNWSKLKDYPHIELSNWRSLAFPVPDYDAQYALKVSK